MKATRLLVVDDSALVRRVLQEQLGEYQDIEIVALAHDPYMARDKIVELKPDVVLLDVEMPRMDGLTFLRKLVRHYPVPVIIFSSLSQKGSAVALDALAAGAVDVVGKPGAVCASSEFYDDLADRIRAAKYALVRRRVPVQEQAVEKNLEYAGDNHRIIAIGASTGGTRAIEDVLVSLPANTPPIVIVQHMPPYFTRTFADRLNRCCKMNVREATDGEQVSQGEALIAPGGFHMMLRRIGRRFSVDVREGPLVHHQCPSVEVLFRSVAKSAAADAVGVILTGMGADGAEGLLAMKNAGAYTIAQDEITSVVYGMPGVAAKLGAACRILPLQHIAKNILENA